ncbi:DUF255 domain-containing protein [Sulfurimonas aquatica]|uniref:DUF255 domain-containing protein n=1 Tax=Sulfurimonas aquatica TaxID=2672570 RepID=A0A975B120_9BACT|nr:thioredoxin family protein [Sulfurimonas aquatica]QSZ42271.1 DUF255 domain-containing protein [Sulfurimonas aquatica]
MKYFIAIAVLSISLFGANIDWPSDYKVALKEAKKQNKLVYIFITSDSCGWCRKFEDTTLQDEYIKERLAKEFISIHISREWDPVPKQFETAPVPRHYFTDSDGEILYSSLGHRGIPCFDGFMDNAIEKNELNKEGDKK